MYIHNTALKADVSALQICDKKAHCAVSKTFSEKPRQTVTVS